MWQIEGVQEIFRGRAASLEMLFRLDVNTAFRNIGMLILPIGR